MRKRIAVFGGGWGGEYLQETLAGIFRITEQNNADAFAFVNFSIRTDIPEMNFGEVNLFRVPELTEFDGVILLANSFNSEEELDYLYAAVKKTGIPAISVEYQLEGIPHIVSDNYSGMYELTQHMISEHHMQNPVMIAGPKDHLESQERVRAFCDAMQANGLSVAPNQIVHGDWAKTYIAELVDDCIAARGGILPDAFICANDIMAIAVCEHMKKLGFRVPRDVKVTGYDCIKLARNRIPSITSVNHEWSSMSAKATQRLFEMIAGKEVPLETVVKTKMVVGGSCGCSVTQSKLEIEELGRTLVLNAIDPIEVDGHLLRFDSAVKKAKTREVVYYSFSYLFAHNHHVEGSDFAIYLDPEFFNVTDGESTLQKHEVCDTYDRIVALHEGKDKPFANVSRKNAIFDAAMENEAPGYYLFLPLHSEGYTYGFAMMTGPLNVANDNQHYIWSRHMIQALEHVRNNMLVELLYNRMLQQSITDPLTGAYNRAGAESVTYHSLMEWTEQKGLSCVMLVDVDHMKLINDRFGHASGDKALCTLTQVAKRELPEGFSLARFGGDEFFIGGRLPKAWSVNRTTATQEIMALIDRIEQSLADTVKKEKIKFPLTISIGAALVKPKNTGDIEKALKKADADMYERKQEHHQKSMMDET